MHPDPVSPPPPRRRLRLWLFAAVLLALVATRFFMLGDKAFHHDESIHCKYSWSLAGGEAVKAGEPRAWNLKAYSYNPVYHGPFLYHWGALWMSVLPDTNAAARVPYALLGVFGVLVLWGLRRSVGWGGALLLMTLATLSPVLCCFARFARNDVYQIAWLAGVIVFGVRWFETRRTRWLTGVTLCFALAYVTKENSYLNNFAPCAFVAGWWLTRFRGGARRALREAFVEHLPLTRLLIVFGAFSVFAFLYVALDSRIGPETGLFEGLSRILTHATSVSERISTDAFAGEQGFFTAPGREAARVAFLRLAFFAPLVLLVLAEFLSRALDERFDLGRALLGTLGAGLFIAVLGWAAASLAAWTREAAPENYLLALSRATLWRALLPAAAAFAPFAVDRFASPDGAAARRLWGMLGLVVQVFAAAWLFAALFTTLGGNAPRGAAAGLYDYLSYWFRHQTGDYRIWGAWWYYVPRLLLYEIAPILLALLAAVLGALALRGPRRPGARPSRAERRRARKEKRLTPDAGESPVVSPPAVSEAIPVWRRPPAPLLVFAGLLTVYMIGLYAVLNEKVAWLLTYQAFGLNLFAGLALTALFASRRPGRVVRRIAAGATALLLAYSGGQLLCSSIVRPDAPSELTIFTQTTHEFSQAAREVSRRQFEARETGGAYKISVSGDGEWPLAWYLRNNDVQWDNISLSANAQFADDTPVNRGRFERAPGGWKVRPLDLRGWWFWHGGTAGLPGEADFGANLKAFLTNAPNDRRDAFPSGEAPAGYVTGFRDQLLAYVFSRFVWYPTGAQRALLCTREGAGPAEGMDAYLDDAAAAPMLLPAGAQFGRRGDGPGAFDEPRGLAYVPGGRLAVADGKNGRIQVFELDGSHLLTFGEGILGADVTGPCGVAADLFGNFYVADTWRRTGEEYAGAVRKFSRTGELLATADKALADGVETGLWGPRGVAVDTRRKRVYVADTGNGFVRVFDLDLAPLASFGGKGDAPGQFTEPVGLALTAAGDLLVADLGGARIQRFSPEGEFAEQMLLPGVEDALIPAAEPHLAMLPDGRVVESVSLDGVVRILDLEKRTARRVRVLNPPLKAPVGVAVQPDGGIWIGDRANALIVRIGPMR